MLIYRVYGKINKNDVEFWFVVELDPVIFSYYNFQCKGVFKNQFTGF